MRTHPKTLTWGVRMVIVALLLVALINVARGQELIIASMVACDTEEQIRDFMSLKEEVPEALKKVNEKHGDQSCIGGQFHIMVGHEVSTMTNHAGTWSIRQVAAFASVEQRVSPIHFLTIPMAEVYKWFTAFPKKDAPA